MIFAQFRKQLFVANIVWDVCHHQSNEVFTFFNPVNILLQRWVTIDIREMKGEYGKGYH